MKVLAVAEHDAVVLRRDEQRVLLDLVSELVPPFVAVCLSCVFTQQLDAAGGDRRAKLHLSHVRRKWVHVGREELWVVLSCLLDLLCCRVNVGLLLIVVVIFLANEVGLHVVALQDNCGTVATKNDPLAASAFIINCLPVPYHSVTTNQRDFASQLPLQAE